MNEAERRAQVITFADRFVSIVTLGLAAYNKQEPPPEDGRFVLSLASYSLSSAFAIAAEPSPIGALLDMVTKKKTMIMIDAAADRITQACKAAMEQLTDFPVKNASGWVIT